MILIFIHVIYRAEEPKELKGRTNERIYFAVSNIGKTMSEKI